ncbi:DUF2157 domain-containing protein [Geitlerinema sp. PCC 7407]|uniref:DUF2157 domain-containing protein n=1 Tax=Geitlerinema sp. PCC 7407 TaxID=1173025 RepID=UPI00029F849F|nr:DUF2157 domain-containing protein [Geitlerinema sp. PCC 7407]AFY64525.1 Protein of unknown function DUF2157, membrane [Geitlerinema sp. PCC 7407]
MASEKFRRQLRQEAERWQTEGLIDPSLLQRLAERYRFEELETAARNRFVAVLLGLGCILLGLGVISFVAANWQTYSRLTKVIMLLTLFVSVNSAGFYLWRSPDPARWQRRLGHGLLILGTLVLGANLALMAQIYHLTGPAHDLYIVWALGVLAMAYCLRLTSLGVISLLLMGIGYWWRFFDGYMGPGALWIEALLRYMPVAALLMFWPLAHGCRSRVIFGLGAIAAVSSFEGNLFWLIPGPWWVAEFWRNALLPFGAALPAALLWGYDDTLWRWAGRPRPTSAVRPFRPIARILAVIFLGMMLYFFSFHWIWIAPTEPLYDNYYGNLVEVSSDWGRTLALWVNVSGFGLLALLEWFHLARQPDQRSLRSEAGLTSSVISYITVLAGLLLLWHFALGPLPMLGPFLLNVLLFLLAVGLMREGLANEDRKTFWSGLLLLTLQIISRVLEYDTGLLLKSLVFVLCGIGIIAVGLWFERYVRTLRSPQLASLPSAPSTNEEPPR